MLSFEYVRARTLSKGAHIRNILNEYNLYNALLCTKQTSI